MDKIEFMNEGGFPLETDVLDALQTALQIGANGLAQLAGELVIISGCEITGNTVTAGIVSINGELYSFKGGKLADNVIIEEVTVQRTFQDGNNNDVYFFRIARFGVSTEIFPWEDFVRLDTLAEMKKKLEPATGDKYGTVKLATPENLDDETEEEVLTAKTMMDHLRENGIAPLRTGSVNFTPEGGGNNVLISFLSVSTSNYRVEKEIYNTSTANTGIVGNHVTGKSSSRFYVRIDELEGGNQQGEWTINWAIYKKQ